MSNFTASQIQLMNEQYRVVTNNGVGVDGPLHKNYEYSGVTSTIPNGADPNTLAMGGTVQFYKVPAQEDFETFSVPGSVANFVGILEDAQAPAFGSILEGDLSRIVGLIIDGKTVSLSWVHNINDVVFKVVNGGKKENNSIKLLDLIRIANGIDLLDSTDLSIRITSLANYPAPKNAIIKFNYEETLSVRIPATKIIDDGKDLKTEEVWTHYVSDNPFLPTPKFNTVLSKDKILNSIQQFVPSMNVLFQTVKQKNPTLRGDALLRKFMSAILADENNALTDAITYLNNNGLTKEVFCNQFKGANYINQLNSAQRDTCKEKIFNISNNIQNIVNKFHGYTNIKPRQKQGCPPEHIRYEVDIVAIDFRHACHFKSIKINDLVTLIISPSISNYGVFLDSYKRPCAFSDTHPNNFYVTDDPARVGIKVPTTYVKVIGENTSFHQPIKYMDQAQAFNLNHQPGWKLALGDDFAFYDSQASGGGLGYIFPMSELKEYLQNKSYTIPETDQYIDASYLSLLPENPRAISAPEFPEFKYDPDGEAIGEKWIILLEDRSVQ